MSKFKIGDMVKIVTYGYGCGFDAVGKIVTITKIGKYLSQTGYHVSPPIGNTLTGSFFGFIGEDTFKPYMCIKKDGKPDWKRRFS